MNSTENTTKYERWPFLKELERIFSICNDVLFAGALAMPVFVVRQDKKVVFRFLPDSHTFVIGSKFSRLKVKDKNDALLTEFIHEMIHMENRRRGVVDCTSNQYHNKKFLETALEKGFYVFQDKAKGWSRTRLTKSIKGTHKIPSDAANLYLLKCVDGIELDESLIEEGQEEIARIVTSSAPAKICFLKYVCQCAPPHNSIRSGRRPKGPHPLKIKCMVCKSKFTCVEDEDEVKE
jgi:hypothetical protein